MTRGLLAVLSFWLIIAVYLHPFEAAPFVDDWVYAWSVQDLLTNHRLEALDYSSNINYAQTLWGAMFCVPFGFSLSALRVSTWVLSCGTLVGVHRLLRESDADAAGAALGAATLAAFPPFLILSFSFMTDVPLLAAETWTLVFFVRTFRRRSTRDLWIGTAAAMVGTSIRLVGVVPPIAMSLALLLDRRGWGRTHGRFLVPASSLLAFGMLAWHSQHHIRHVTDLTSIYMRNTPTARLLEFKRYAIWLLPDWLPLSAEFMAAGLGLALFPIAVALERVVGERRRLVTLIAASAVLVTIGHLTGGLHYHAFASEGTWMPDELGATMTLLPGWVPRFIPFAATLTATLTCWAAFLVIGASATRPVQSGQSTVLLVWTLAGLVLTTALLWLVSDRYIFPFIPPALALVLGGRARVSWQRAMIVLGLFAGIGFVGLRDRVEAQNALWLAVNDLQRSGVPVSQIDAGYVVNGWLQYAHPDQANRDAAGHVAVPWVNDASPSPWVIATTPLSNTDVVREVQVPSNVARSGSDIRLEAKARASGTKLRCLGMSFIVINRMNLTPTSYSRMSCVDFESYK